ncbi:MAG: hypothetical protein AAF441_25750 [Pseudomonadota bacterium]
MLLRTRFYGVLGGAILAFGGIWTGTAAAAPQALALVETRGTVELTCNGTECGAELTSFCLDGSRFSPRTGTRYELATAPLVRLTAYSRRGERIELDAKEHIRFQSLRRHLAVKASIDENVLKSRGLTDVKVEILAHAALLPVPWKGDPKAITPGEAELFKGPLRKLGSRLVDRNSSRMQAARITSRIINLLPDRKYGAAPSTSLILKKAIEKSGGEKLNDEARRRAKGAVDLCRYVSRVNSSISFRRCLQERHDGMVDYLNSKYWKAVKSGT